MQKSGYCLICFKPLFEAPSLSYFILQKNIICTSCHNKFDIFKKKMIINGISILFLYKYNYFAKEIIYKYKGCYDIELKNVFLYDFLNYIRFKYRGYTIIFPPSNKKDDKERGYNHVEEIIKTLKMPYENIFYKNCDYKQSSMTFNKRKEIEKIIKLKGKITNKKYLIIDDIYTSGSTIKTIINILLRHHVDKKNIKGLILFKVIS